MSHTSGSDAFRSATSEITMSEISKPSLAQSVTSAPESTSAPAKTEAPFRASLFGDEMVPFKFTWKDFYNRNFYISGAWDLEYYYTIRGSENFHLYLWIAKDWSWTQAWYWPSMIFGTLAVAWCLVLAKNAFDSGLVEEMYMLIALVLWLSANYVWMVGEIAEGDDDYVVPRVGIMMETSIAWILFFHVILKPFRIMPEADYDQSSYSRPGLVCRFSYFKYWRQYEHAHTFCWLGKDLSWNTYNPYTWVLCLIPTVLIAVDFIWVTFRTKCMMEDCLHYVAQLLWVVGNMFWAMGNIFILSDDDGSDDSAYNMFAMTAAAKARLRNWGSWMLFVAYWPLILLYLVWIPMTLRGVFEDRASVIHFREQKLHAIRASELKASMIARPSDMGSPSLYWRAVAAQAATGAQPHAQTAVHETTVSPLSQA